MHGWPMKGRKSQPRRAIPSSATGRIDLERLAAQVDWDHLSPFEQLVLGGCPDYGRLFDEVKACPGLASLRWGENDATLLCWAAGDGQLKLVRLLVRLGADANASSAGYGTPLHHAAPHDVEISRLLLKHGADVNAVSGNGRVALHDAVMAWNLPVVKLLLHHGADVHVKDRYGHTPLDLALIRRYPDVVAELVNRGARIENLKAVAALLSIHQDGWLSIAPGGKLRARVPGG